MDNYGDLIKINLVDNDGIIVSGTTYKVANGSKILMFCDSYPIIKFDNNFDTSENQNTIISTTNTLSTVLGPTKFSGNARPVISMNILIPISTTIPTRTQYNAMSGTVAMSFYLLYNLWRYPHRIYLNDMITNNAVPNTDYPINILINRTDLLNQTVFSSLGVPVVLKSVNLVSEESFTHKDTTKEEVWFKYKLEFAIDNYGT